MQGVISAINFIDQIGMLQCEDGRAIGFAREGLEEPELFDFLMLNTRAEFTLNEAGKVRSLRPEQTATAADDRSYELPSEVSFEKGHLRDGYEILDVGKIRLSRTTRVRQRSYVELASLCRSLGGNTLLEVQERSQQRTAMGYAFVYYTVTGFAAAAGRPVSGGGTNASELLQSLNHREIRRIGARYENKAAGKIALRLTGAILLGIFALGFVLSLLFQSPF